MATISEDYVSFEVAKLLAKKSFDYSAEYESYYTLDGTIVYFKDNPQEVNIAPRITLQMAMKWLREVHNLFIQFEVTPWPRKGFFVKIYLYKKQHNDFEEVSYVKYEKSYEQACEAAIKYCLENLI